MKHRLFFVACLGGAIATLSLAAQSQSPKPKDQSPYHTKDQAYSSEGERVFKQNCSRCHDAPQSFSPQISGTVVRHMRVRASLSEQDEKSLLKFLNP